MENLVSIIVPAYNEEGNIELLVNKLFEMIENREENYEVIIVDDGSTDRTLEMALKMKELYPQLKIAKHRKNFGLTQALITGNSIANGDAIVLFPADLQFDVKDIPRLNKRLRDGFDIVTGKKIGKYEKKFVSKIYNYLSKKLFNLPNIRTYGVQTYCLFDDASYTIRFTSFYPWIYSGNTCNDSRQNRKT